MIKVAAKVMQEYHLQEQQKARDAKLKALPKNQAKHLHGSNSLPEIYPSPVRLVVTLRRDLNRLDCAFASMMFRFRFTPLRG